MSPFLSELWQEFGVVKILAALILSGLQWVIIWSFGKAPVRRAAFAIALTLLNFSVLSYVSAMIRSSSMPKLAVDAAATLGEISRQENDGPVTFAYVSMVTIVANTGDPTSLVGFSLELVRPGAPVIVGDRQTIPMEGMPIPVPGNRAVQWICGADALDRRATAPIPRGGQATGRLLFILRDATLQSFRSPGAELVLTIVDAWGKEHKTRFPVTEQPRFEVRDFPGLPLRPRTPLIQPSSPALPNEPANTDHAPQPLNPCGLP